VNSLPPPIPPPPISVPPSNDESNFAGPLRYHRLAIASLVCGLFVPSLPFIAFTAFRFAPSPPKRLAILIIIAPPVAFVLGIVALRRIKAEPERLKGRGMALAGMILGALSIGLFVLIWLVFSSSSCSVCVL
jgi:hypothetical protein